MNEESFETGKSQNSNADAPKTDQRHRGDDKLLERLLESESGEEDNTLAVGKSRKAKLSRLSSLSKLNLLGLIDLALIACNLKQHKNVETAIIRCEDSILLLKDFNRENEGDIGIAA